MRSDIQEAQIQAVKDLVSQLVEEQEVTIQPFDGEQVNDDIYHIGLLETEATLDDVIYKVNEIVTYLNKNIGGYR